VSGVLLPSGAIAATLAAGGRCPVVQFALGAGQAPFFGLGKAGFENLHTMEVQILAKGMLEGFCIRRCGRYSCTLGLKNDFPRFSDLPTDCNGLSYNRWITQMSSGLPRGW